MYSAPMCNPLPALAVALGLVCCADSAGAAGTPIAALDFELKDLTLDPNNQAERERTASLGPLLREALASRGCRVIEVDSAAQNTADKGAGYLFDHADLAAALGRAFGAQWIVVGRVHKASFLFVYLKAHVVNATTGELTADLSVEVKGPQKTLTRRGVDALADQISAVIDSNKRSDGARGEKY